MKPTDIITSSEIERVHGNANYGPGISKREVVDYGLLKAACGYHNGSTTKAILADHGLTRDARKTGTTALTARGRKYLWAVFGDAS